MHSARSVVGGIDTTEVKVSMADSKNSRASDALASVYSIFIICTSLAEIPDTWVIHCQQNILITVCIDL